MGGFNINGTRSAAARLHRRRRHQPQSGEQHRRARLGEPRRASKTSRCSRRTTRPSTAGPGGGFIALTTRGGTNRVSRRPAAISGATTKLNANTFFNNARGGERRRLPAARPTGSTTTGGIWAARCRSTKSGSPQDVLLRGAGDATTSSCRRRRRSTSGCRPQLERAGNFSQSVDGTGRRDHDHRSADRPAVPRQRHPGRTASMRPGRAALSCSADAELDRGRQRLQLHLAGSRASIRAARTSCAWTGRSRTTRA